MRKLRPLLMLYKMMKNILWLSLACFISVGAQAQHEEKVQIKIDQIQNLMGAVSGSALEASEKSWAKKSLQESLKTLENNQSESDIDKLKRAELEINKINQLVVQAMIEAQRLKLITKIKEIDVIIMKYSDQGMETEKLQLLQAGMIERLALYD